ncbi:hypothetical protein [Streptomyces sirii]|uniref:hypothetical protein n=1 Tax=Streptomyces sirii TaxID=3127701 RepID=UPI003D36BE94
MNSFLWRACRYFSAWSIDEKSYRPFFFSSAFHGTTSCTPAMSGRSISGFTFASKSPIEAYR